MYEYVSKRKKKNQHKTKTFNNKKKINGKVNKMRFKKKYAKKKK